VFSADGQTPKQTDGRTDRHTLREYKSLFEILRTCLKRNGPFKNEKSGHPNLYEMCPQLAESAEFTFLLPVDNTNEWNYTSTDFMLCHGVPLPSP
jgi:hypothetical protein